MHTFMYGAGEADRPWFTTDESHDVDHVMTTMELATIFKERGIDLPVSELLMHLSSKWSSVVCA